MSPERFAQIEQVFQNAMDQPPAERVRFAAQVCSGDAELLREVTALLDSQGPAETQLNELIGSMAAAVDKALPAGEIGQSIGPYLLVREIGRGGMGIVYHAVRVDGEFIHSVAIKLVKRGMDTEDVLRRFRAERQILATLSHPNIGALLDGGTTGDGRPYFVMEFIEGKPLIGYCADNSLSLSDRLRLFRDICAAVHYAHERQVIHRDLKPGNVLVTSDGTPKLLDFGIAKLLAPELIPGGLPLTVAAHRVLTPEYASPEQIRGDEVTRSTDVYSLGAILYELITGQRAYPAAGRTTSQLERAICEEPPPIPSRSARVRIPADLDAIVEMAMGKDAAHRYSSAAQLSEDIRRFLAEEPILARRDSTARRFVSAGKRFRVPAAIAALALILAISWLVAEFFRERLRVSRLPQDPVILRKYLRANDLLSRNPARGEWPIGIPPNVAEAIRLLEEVTTDSDQFGRGWALLADAYNISSEFDPRLRMVLQKRAWRAASRAVSVDPESGEGYAILGELALYRDWDLPGAERLLKQALNLNQGLQFSRRQYADVLRITGRPDEARAEIDRALLLDPTAARLHTQRAILLSDTGRCAEAIESADRALHQRPDQTEPIWVKGLCREREGDYNAARNLFAAALQIAPSDGRALPAMGHLYGMMGLRDDALRLLREVERLGRRGRVVDYSVALIYAGLDDRKHALDALEAAWRSRDTSMLYIGVEWRFRKLRQEPEFQELLRRLRLIR